MSVCIQMSTVEITSEQSNVHVAQSEKILFSNLSAGVDPGCKLHGCQHVIEHSSFRHMTSASPLSWVGVRHFRDSNHHDACACASGESNVFTTDDSLHSYHFGLAPLLVNVASLCVFLTKPRGCCRHSDCSFDVDVVDRIQACR